MQRLHSWIHSPCSFLLKLGGTSLDLNNAREDRVPGWQWHQLDHTQTICTSLQLTVPELITVLGSQPACDVGHKPGGRLPLLSARPAVTPATLKRAATNFAAW